jgi:uncharacterized protein (DUF1800 family)
MTPTRSATTPPAPAVSCAPLLASALLPICIARSRLARWALATLLACPLAAGTAQAQEITVYSDGAVPVGTARQLTAYVPLSPATVAWAVNGVSGGNGIYGTVGANGLYRAPANVPAANAVRVSATSTAYAQKTAFATITVTQTPLHLWSASPARVNPGNVSLRLNGSNFSASTVVKLADQTLTATLVSPTQIVASGTVPAAAVGKSLALSVSQTGLGATTSETVSVPVVAAPSPSPSPSPGPAPAPGPSPAPNPAPNPGSGLGTANLAAARLLEQAAFGPTPAAIARVKLIGAPAWIDEQLAMPETPIANPGGMASSTVQAQWLARLANSPDQLRQRMATALGSFIVISLQKNIYPDEIVPYLQILSRNAFGNFRALLGEIATSSQMGKYLDLANSNKPGAGGAANENFARELMQLFTMGLVRLNADGTPQLDASANTTPTYTQAEVQQLALAVTGWTYPGPGANNWENFSGPLVSRDVNHDQTAKHFLGCNLSAGQTAKADLDAALDCIFAHPNVPPFVALRLIRALVTSNPSPAYVARVAAVFANNGGGVRGDLKATLKAVLLDAEARNDAAAIDAGRLKDPVQQVVGLVRALGGGIAAGNQQAWSLSLEGQAPLAPNSVFGFYSPLFRIPHTALAGPEFQIYSPTEAVLRGNYFWDILSNPGSDFTLDLGPFISVAGNSATLIDLVDQALLHGRMPAAMRQSIANAVAVHADNRSRALAALYLAALSGQQAIQY